MRVSLLILSLITFSACATSLPATATPYPTSTPYPTYTPLPTPDLESAYEAFLNALQDRIQNDDSIPQVGRDSIILLAGKQPTYVFPENRGNVLQFLADMPDNEPNVKKTGVLLMGTSLIVANEQGVPLEGIEVVFFTKKNDPWLALALVPPWEVQNDLRLKPLHPDFIQRLLEAGVITPTPRPTY